MCEGPSAVPSPGVESMSLSEMRAGRRGRGEAGGLILLWQRLLVPPRGRSFLYLWSLSNHLRENWAGFLGESHAQGWHAIQVFIPQGGRALPAQTLPSAPDNPLNGLHSLLDTPLVSPCPYLSLLGGLICCLPRVLRCSLGFWKSIIWNLCTSSIVVLDQSSFQVSASQCWDQTPHHRPKQRNEAKRLSSDHRSGPQYIYNY